MFCSRTVRIRGSQRDVIYIGWPIAPSYMSPMPEFIKGSFQLENKLKMLISENERFRQEINADQRHSSFSGHFFQHVLDRTKPIPSFWRRKWKTTLPECFHGKQAIQSQLNTWWNHSYEGFFTRAYVLPYPNEINCPNPPKMWSYIYFLESMEW